MKNKSYFSAAAVTAFGAAFIVSAIVMGPSAAPGWFWSTLSIGALLLLAGVFEIRSVKSGAAPRGDYKLPPEYRVKKALLSPPEKAFFLLLKRLLSPEHFEIFPQVALCAVIDKLTQNSYRNELFRIPDFCIVNQKSFEPLLFIELNDASHNKPERRERDRKVLEICASADMPIVAFSMEEACDETFVKKVLKKLL